MGHWIAHECVRALTLRGCTQAMVTVLGMTFKEDVPDIRNSKVIDIIIELRRFGIQVQIHDPLALADETRHEYNIDLTKAGDLKPADAVILAVSHQQYLEEGWGLMTRLLKSGKGSVIDVKSKLDRTSKPEGVDLWRL